MAPKEGELDLNRGGNNIAIDNATITLGPDAAGDLGAALGSGLTSGGGGGVFANAVGAAVASALAGEGGLGVKGLKENLGFGAGEIDPQTGKAGFDKTAAAKFVLQPIGDVLRTGLEEILKNIDTNIAGARFGGGAGALEGFRGISGRGFEEATGINLAGDLGLKESEIPGIVKILGEIGPPFSKFKQGLTDTEFDRKIAGLARTYQFLNKGLGLTEEEIKKQIETFSAQSRSIEEVNEKLRDKFPSAVAAFAKATKQSFGAAGAEIANFAKQFAFLGGEAETEAVRLGLLSNKLGVTLGGIFTKDLVSFDEAAELGASLGTVLKGINFDLNDFVNSKPSERVGMVFGELADAIDEGRFEIEEDGVKFGQQVSILQQALGGEFSKTEVTRILKEARDAGGTSDAIRAAIEQAQALAGERLSAEEVKAGAMGQRTREQAQDAPVERALQGAQAGAVRESAIGELDAFNKAITENNFLKQTLPLVEALTEFNIVTKKFGTEGEGVLSGLVRNALLGDAKPTEVLSTFNAKVEEASSEFGKTMDALKGRAKDTADALAGIVTAVGPAAEKLSKDAANIDKTGITGFSDKLTDTVVQVFASPKVTDAIAESMRKAGVAAVNNTKVGSP